MEEIHPAISIHKILLLVLFSGFFLRSMRHKSSAINPNGYEKNMAKSQTHIQLVRANQIAQASAT
jgi:hypothetical protein